MKKNKKMKDIIKGLRLIADIKMNQPIDNADIISPGNFTFTFVNKSTIFDFCCPTVSINEDNQSIHIDCEALDSEYSSQILDLTLPEIQRVTSIDEIFIFTGEKGETTLKPIKLLGCTLEVETEDDVVSVGIPTSICKKAKMTSNI